MTKSSELPRRIDVKFTQVTGLKLKFGTIRFLGKSIFPWQRQTENHKNQYSAAFMRIRFDAKNLISITETMLYCKSNIQE